MRHALTLVSALLCLGWVAAAQDPPPQKESPPAAELKVPPEDAKRANPVKSTEDSIAVGRRLFVSQCAMCHGADGDGKGELAQELKLGTHDWRDPASLKEKTDGTLFYILTKGHAQMPGQGDRLKVEQRWHLVNFIRSLARKEPTKEAPKGLAKPPAGTRE